jgi:putative ABC transport system ATP-binding protein
MDLLVEHLRHEVLRDIGLSVPAAQTLCVYGRSGSGKSLLLRAIADLDPNQGEVRLGEVRRSALSAPQWRHLVAYLPPESHWWLDTVRGHAADWPLPQLEQLGFDPQVLDWEISRLSTGERQRLSIVRALARQPRALLLDEPTANLDQTSVLAVEQLLKDYQAQHQAPMVWVSHDPAQRQRIADSSREMLAGALQ